MSNIPKKATIIIITSSSLTNFKTQVNVELANEAYQLHGPMQAIPVLFGFFTRYIQAFIVNVRDERAIAFDESSKKVKEEPVK